MSKQLPSKAECKQNIIIKPLASSETHKNTLVRINNFSRGKKAHLWRQVTFSAIAITIEKSKGRYYFPCETEEIPG